MFVVVVVDIVLESEAKDELGGVDDEFKFDELELGLIAIGVVVVVVVDVDVDVGETLLRMLSSESSMDFFLVSMRLRNVSASSRAELASSLPNLRRLDELEDEFIGLLVTSIDELLWAVDEEAGLEASIVGLVAKL